MEDKGLPASIVEYDGSIAYVSEQSYSPEPFVGTRYYYIISQVAKDLYCARTTPESTDPTTIKNMRLPFPPEWRGAVTGKLRKLTHIEDLVSCDGEGEFCITRTLEGAVKAALLSLNGSGHNCFQCPWACPHAC